MSEENKNIEDIKDTEETAEMTEEIEEIEETEIAEEAETVEASDAVEEESVCLETLEELPEKKDKKKGKKRRSISIPAFLLSSVALVLATLMLTYSICTEAFKSKYADGLVKPEPEEITQTTEAELIDLLGQFIDGYFYGDADKEKMLAEALKAGDVFMCMGNSDVPVGQYTQKILAYYELSEEELANAGVITYGTNVKEVTTQVSEATVDCGIIYGTDAYSAGLTVVDTATAEMCGQVIYPAAVLNITKNEEAAKAFLAYLTGEEASAVFESVGFSPMAK